MSETTPAPMPHGAVTRLGRRREKRHKAPEYAPTAYDKSHPLARDKSAEANLAEKDEDKHSKHKAAQDAHMKAADDAPSVFLKRVHTQMALEHNKLSEAFSPDEIKKRKKLEDAAKIDAKQAAKLRMEENEHGTNMRIKEASAQARLATANAKKLEAEAVALKAKPAPKKTAEK